MSWAGNMKLGCPFSASGLSPLPFPVRPLVAPLGLVTSSNLLVLDSSVISVTGLVGKAHKKGRLFGHRLPIGHLDKGVPAFFGALLCAFEFTPRSDPLQVLLKVRINHDVAIGGDSFFYRQLWGTRTTQMSLLPRPAGWAFPLCPTH